MHAATMLTLKEANVIMKKGELTILSVVNILSMHPGLILMPCSMLLD